MPGAKEELGEGRSKSIYLEPTVSDTAVVLAFYNPAKFKRILKNMLYVIQVLKEKNIPYFVIECVFNGAEPEIPDATLVVHSNSYMFYKEQLINKLEPLIPEQYTKLVCIDGDVIFEKPDWVDEVSAKLDTVDIIQPFSEACWLTPDNTRIKSKKKSYAFALVNDKTSLNQAVNIHAYHPGFAWAFKRDIFRKIGGFYPRSIIGNGDTVFVFNFFVDTIPKGWINSVIVTDFILGDWPTYHEKFKSVNPTVGYLDGMLFHLFHGVRQNRQYTTRYKSMAHLLKGTWDDIITTNEDGLYEFKDPMINKQVLAYFKRRNEDVPLEEAQRINAATRRRNVQPLNHRRITR